MSNTQQKLISILGTTATGKTQLALSLAEKIIQENLAKGVNLISADSRQVYQGLEILTGADIPPDFSFKKKLAHDYRFAQHQTLPIFLHGISIIQPAEEWSVAHFRNLAINLIKQSWAEDFLPIIVGGTAFYHKQLLNNDPDIYIKPDLKLREKLETLSVEQLQQELSLINPEKFNQMNQSDQNNPRRLFRAIEVEQAKENLPDNAKDRAIFNQPQQQISIGLQADLKTLNDKINQRVEKRFNNGAIEEVKQLLALNLPPSAPAMTTLGVEQIQSYLNKKLNTQQAIQDWSLAEFQYAKRQITWLKKLPIDLWLNSQPETFWPQIRKNLL